MRLKIGFIGLGLMGSPMAGHLLKQFGELHVWNRSLVKLLSLTDKGAVAVSTPKELAATVDVICMCITDKVAVREVLFGAEGIGAANKEGLIIVDHSTLAPFEAVNIMQEVNDHRMHYMDAPVTGSVPGAVNGTLSVFVGGDEAVFNQITPIMAAYAKRMSYMGACGAGQATKMCNQVMLHNTICATFETLHFARQQGLDVERFFLALEDSLIDSKAWRIFGGASIQQDPPRLAHIRDVMKDMNCVNMTAKASGSELFLYEVVSKLVGKLIAEGLGGEDIVELTQVYVEHL